MEEYSPTTITSCSAILELRRRVAQMRGERAALGLETVPAHTDTAPVVSCIPSAPPTQELTVVYRGMNVDKIAEGNWQWCDPRVDPEVMYGPFGSDEEAMADIDRHKKAQADARA